MCEFLFWEERGDVVFWGVQAVEGETGRGNQRRVIGDIGGSEEVVVRGFRKPRR